jgi:hypothetical protein
LNFKEMIFCKKKAESDLTLLFFAATIKISLPGLDPVRLSLGWKSVGSRKGGWGALSSFTGFVATSLNKCGRRGIPHGFIFMNQLGGSFPGSASIDNRFSQGEFAAAGRTPLGVERVEFLKINDEGLSFSG